MLNEASSNEPLGEAMGCEVSVVQEASSCHHYQRSWRRCRLNICAVIFCLKNTTHRKNTPNRTTTCLACCLSQSEWLTLQVGLWWSAASANQSYVHCFLTRV